MQVQRFVEHVRVGHESDGLAIFHDSIALLLDFLYRHDIATARTQVLRGGSASVGLINRRDLVTQIENKEAIRLFAHEKEVVAKSQHAILGVSLRHALESFRELLLLLVNKQFALVLLVEVISLRVCSEVDIFGPVADTGLCTIAGTT